MGNLRGEGSGKGRPLSGHQRGPQVGKAVLNNGFNLMWQVKACLLLAKQRFGIGLAVPSERTLGVKSPSSAARVEIRLNYCFYGLFD
jgi:hypothetical protein